MKKIKSYKIQLLKRYALLGLVLPILAGCADALDQTNGDLDSPNGGMLRIAGQMHDAGDDQGAMEFYARAIQRMPDDATARQRLAELLEAHNDNDDAAEQYRALTNLKPDTIEFHRAYGRVLIKLDRLDDAKVQYEAALAIDGNDIKSLNGLGVALDLQGDHQGAQQRYQAALQQAPDDLATINNLGHSYVLAGAYGDAVRVMEPVYQNPSVPAALRENLAVAYAMNGMDIDAARVLGVDRSPEEVKKTLAHYHAIRAGHAAPLVFANLGSFTTSALAEERLNKVRAQFAPQIGELSLEVVPKVDAPGGTPDFYAQVIGFKSIEAARNFCEKLAKGGAFCNAREG